MSLISGNADAMVYPEETLLRLARQSGIEDHIKTTGDALAEIKRAIGVRKGQPELFNRLDETVKAFILTPEYEKIYAKWYAKPEPYWNTQRVLMVVGIVIALAAAIFIIFHYFSVLRLNKKLADNLTQLEKSEESLRNSEELFRTVLNNAPITIFAIDNQGVFTLSEGKSLEKANLKSGENVGVSALDLFATIPVIQPNGETINGREVVQRVLAGETLTGITKLKGVYFDNQFVPYRDAQGKIIGIIGVATIITERKRAEEQILQQKEFLNNIFESLTHPFYVIDASDHGILMANPAACMNLPTAGSKCFALTHKRKIPCSGEDICPLEEVKKTKKPVTVEHIHYDKDGYPQNVEVHGYPIFDKEGNVIQMIEYCLDITDRKKAEETRLENLRLEASDKAKSEFLANMSHELRTPLNSSMGFSELLKDGMAGDLNEKQRHFVEIIFTSNQFLLTLINDILDLSKIEAGKIELVPQKMSVPISIRETFSLINEKAMKHKVLLKTEIEPDFEFIEADKQRVKQILFNLLSNAVKFSKEEGGVVTIKAKKEGDMAQISVSDTGIGIKKENLSKLFQKFEQLDSSISKKYGGTGLGLAITKQLVEMHGGKIWAESKYGEGSTFTFLLPIGAKKMGET